MRLCKALDCGKCGCLKPIRACCVVKSAFFLVAPPRGVAVSNLHRPRATEPPDVVAACSSGELAPGFAEPLGGLDERDDIVLR